MPIFQDDLKVINELASRKPKPGWVAMMAAQLADGNGSASAKVKKTSPVKRSPAVGNKRPGYKVKKSKARNTRKSFWRCIFKLRFQFVCFDLYLD